MSDQNDDTQSYALMVLAGVVALVIAGVIALAVSTTMGPAAPKPTESVAAPAAPAENEPAGRLYFELGSAALPADAASVLAHVADAARASPNQVVLISGYHDESGDPVKNAELAKERAKAVRHALEANGVAADKLVLDKPLVAAGGTDAREARRVELRLH